MPSATQAPPARRRRAQSKPAVEKVDPRNKLNDLSNRQWLILTKSVWESIAPPRDPLKLDHPATFSEEDVARLIALFTKRGQRVLDPFVGSGSTLVACAMTEREGVGIELVEHWVKVARRRALNALEQMADPIALRVIQGDAAEVLDTLADESFDFIVTSPPYWKILRKDKGMKTKAERKSKGLKTRYSDDPRDLGNIEDYGEFLSRLAEVFARCHRVLKYGAYMAVIVSDFRHGKRFVMYHADLARRIEEAGFLLQGITVLVQNNKNLYAYGIPYRFIPNVHHQYILIFTKLPRD